MVSRDTAEIQPRYRHAAPRTALSLLRLAHVSISPPPYPSLASAVTPHLRMQVCVTAIEPDGPAEPGKDRHAVHLIPLVRTIG